MIDTRAYAAFASDQPLAPWKFQRREPRPNDVVIEITWAGICHSDLHTARSEWSDQTFPIVVGHEILGRVTRTGAEAKRFKVGDLVGVGVIVDSCRTCASCKEGLQQYCDEGMTQAYGSPDPDTGITHGGYSS